MNEQLLQKEKASQQQEAPASEPGDLSQALGELEECSLLNGRVRLLQPARGYRVAIDPVLLAAAVPARPGERLLELGCGSAAASLCLLARVVGLDITGLELNFELAELARRNAALNNPRLHVIQGDLLSPPACLADSFDQVFMNPPYLPAGAAIPSPFVTRASANVEREARLEHWISAALQRLTCGGRLTLIHRADRLGEILSLLHERAGETRILPLRAYADRPAKRVIVTTRKASRAPLVLLPDLVLHDPGGGFSAAAEAVLRAGEAIKIAP